MSHRVVISLVLLAALLAGLLALSLKRPWHAPDAVRVAFLPIYVDLPLFVAVERGFMAKRGIELELIRFQDSPAMAAALVGGRVDAVASIATHSALAIETRDPGRFRVFLVDAEDPQNYLSSLLVSSSSQITSPSALAGKTIGSFPGPTAVVWGPMALEALGLKRNEFTIQELPIGSHTTALETNRIDAVITYEPVATQAVEKYGARKLVPGLIETHVIDPWQAGIWIVTSEMLKERRDYADRFVQAIYEAVDFIRKHPEAAKADLAQYTTIDLSIAVKTPTIPFTKVSEVNLVRLQEHADLLTNAGRLSRPVDVAPLMMEILPNDR